MESTREREFLETRIMGTRFLMTCNKPEKGFECQGIETLTNGFKETIETEKLRSVKEISTNKYICSSKTYKYLVDVI